MIATLAFEPARERVRRARFVPAPGLPVDAACVVANGIREGLRTLLGEACSVAIGEPVALDAAAWRALTRDALLFATPGAATDVVFVLPLRDARRLVAAAFGEAEAGERAGWSALEAGAAERIVARCANACDVLCAERRGPTRSTESAQIPRAVAAFDVRVTAPLTFTLAVGILRALPEAPPGPPLGAAVLDDVPLEVRAVLGHGTLALPQLLALRAGDVVRLATKVADAGELKVGGKRIALGTCGLRSGRAAFEVRSAILRGDPW